MVGGELGRVNFSLQLGHQKSVTEKAVVEQSLEECEGMSHVGIWEKSIVDLWNKMYAGPTGQVAGCESIVRRPV